MQEVLSDARTASRIRVLIVDDSAVMRSLLRSVVSTDSLLEVAGTASDGLSALNALAMVRPDVVLMDVEMPVMDGLETLKQMRERAPRLPIIMCSALTQRGAHVTIESLASGASDYVAKPAGQANREAATQALSAELIPKIRALTMRSRAPLAGRKLSMFPAAIAPRSTARHATAPAAVVLGVSTGGPAALDVILPALPASFPLPVFVVQHMPDLFTRQLAERLNTRSALRVREAEEGMAVHGGQVYIARGNWHLKLTAASAPGQFPTLHLDQAPEENHCRPSVDVLFRSAAQLYGGNVLAVMLTGMGHDGLDGTRILHKLGATIVAQDEATSAVWGMPGAVVHEGLAHDVLPLRRIAAEILRLTAQPRSEAPLLQESAG